MERCLKEIEIVLSRVTMFNLVGNKGFGINPCCKNIAVLLFRKSVSLRRESQAAWTTEQPVKEAGRLEINRVTENIWLDLAPALIAPQF